MLVCKYEDAFTQHNIFHFTTYYIYSTLLSRAFAREHYYKLFRKSFAASTLLKCFRPKLLESMNFVLKGTEKPSPNRPVQDCPTSDRMFFALLPVVVYSCLFSALRVHGSKPFKIRSPYFLDLQRLFQRKLLHLGLYISLFLIGFCKPMMTL